MKSRETGATITSNDGLVRLRIFDGVIPPDDYHRELAELERGQHAAARSKFLRFRGVREARISELEAALGRALDYCDAATHGDGQYADERSALIRVWRGA